MKLLKDFVENCSKNMNLLGVVQFGSSTHTQDAKDIDLVFFSKNEVFSDKDYFALFNIIKKSEMKNKEIVFDIGGGKRERKGKISITVVPINKLDLDLIKKGVISLDAFFFKNISEDKNKKLLFGKDPTDFNIVLSKIQIEQLLSIEINYSIRGFLDSETKMNSAYYLFKTCLRYMLSDEGGVEKDNLLDKFKIKYPEINIPKNSNKIINKEIAESDIKDILSFSQEYLKFLIKN